LRGSGQRTLAAHPPTACFFGCDEIGAALKYAQISHTSCRLIPIFSDDDSIGARLRERSDPAFHNLDRFVASLLAMMDRS
jgi:hypothetical protein